MWPPRNLNRHRAMWKIGHGRTMMITRCGLGRKSRETNTTTPTMLFQAMTCEVKLEMLEVLCLCTEGLGTRRPSRRILHTTIRLSLQRSAYFSVAGAGYFSRHFLPQTCVITTPAKKATARIIA